MMNKGAIFSQLRARMLDAIPTKAVVAYGSSRTIGDWLHNGFFTVNACRKDKIVLETNPDEYGAILLNECECLMNHCLEHIQEMICIGNDTRVRSQAWAIVTAYYLGFFAAGAFLRLIGEPIVFLTTEQLKRLQAIKSSNLRPGQGAFHFKINRQISITRSEITLRKTGKIHEATWKNVLGVLDQLNNDTSLSKSQFEVLLYSSLCSKLLFPQYDNFQWPSIVRNRANYRPGFMYRLDANLFDFKKLFEAWRNASAPDVHKIIAQSITRCSCDPANFAHHSDAMLNVSTTVYLLARTLYAELLSRRRADRRWEQQRKNYCKKLNTPDTQYELLLASVGK